MNASRVVDAVTQRYPTSHIDAPRSALLPDAHDPLCAGAWNYVAETKEDLPWADLVTLDLAKYDTTEGKKELAAFLLKALREKGFFYVKNFNMYVLSFVHSPRFLLTTTY